MDRRDFLLATKTAPKRPEINISRPSSGINPYTGAWTNNEVQHLLKRTMFGSPKKDIDYFKSKTLSQSVDELLNPLTPVPAPPVNDYNAGAPDATVPAGQTWVNTPINDGNLNGQRRNSFKKWWTGLQVNQDKNILEKMTLFWANHFSTEATDIGNAHYIFHHNALLRKNALGNFKQLVKGVTIDAGMLRYLNGYLNTAAAPDENYARELKELFTIGKGPAAKYTEDDIKKAAKVLTGWRINGNTYTVFFDASKHDTSSKTFSSFYNGTTIAGRTGAAGAAETDDLINMIFTNNEVAKFICRRLYIWFVYYKIDANVETNVIEPLAQLFRNNNYEIKPVLSALLKSEHFFDVMNQGCQIKSPADHVIGCLREFHVVFPNNTSEYLDAYAMWNYIRGWMVSMTQDLGDPPSVSGWPAYYQAPQFYEIWINSDTLPKRNRFTDTMISSGYTRAGKKIIIDAVSFTKTFSDPSNPVVVIDEALNILYRVPLTATHKQTLKQQILLSNQTSDHYWTSAWAAYLANPTDATAYNTVNSRLKTLYQYLMNLAEYQLA